jgi:ABC-2 type transport system ATP-binding protein
MTMSLIVEVKDLRKQYTPPQGTVAVEDVSFAIRTGEIFSLLGPNGAVKTTIISMLSCLLQASAGDALVDGHSITKQPRRVKQLIGVVPQEIALYDTITARENLHFWGKMYSLSGQKLKERTAAVLDLVGLTARADEKIATFSGGMKRRINIAVALLHEPKILYMDEPTVGIDPQSRRRILDSVKEMNKQGLTVLYTTHYMEEAQELSHRIGIIDNGRLIALGTLAELTATVGHYDVVRLDVGRTPEENGHLVACLAELPAVHRAGGEGEHLVLQVEKADTALPDIFRQVTAAGLPVRRLEIEEPNLEAVFLHLTGRALRD